MSWYTGKPLLEYLETVHIGSDKNFADLRYPVQYVMRPNHDFPGFSSTVASGIIRKGDEVVALPSMKRSRVKSIVTYDGELDFAFPPQAITVTLEDRNRYLPGRNARTSGQSPDYFPQFRSRWYGWMRRK